MWVLWLVFALLTVIAAVWLLRPLFKTYSDAALLEKEKKAGKRKELNIELFKQKQVQIEQDFAIGLIDAESLVQAQNEIEHSLLHEVDDVDETPIKQLDSGSAKKLGLAVALFVPIFSVITYLMLTPDNLQQIVMAEKLPEQPARHGQGQAPDIDTMVRALEKKLLENPDNLQGWVMLGRSYIVTKKYDKAVNAYSKAVELDQSANSELSIDYGEVLMQTGLQSNYLLAYTVFQHLLDREPDNLDALWFIGFLDFEAGNKSKAIQRWSKLMTMLPPESEEAKVVANYLSRVKGEVPQGSAAASETSSEAQPTAVVNSATVAMPPVTKPPVTTKVPRGAPVFENKESEQAFINSMIARVEQRVKDNPKDIKSWKMLGKSYAVQKRYADSSNAYAQAVALDSSDVQLLMDYSDAVMNTGGIEQFDKARLVFAQMVKENPDNADALFLSGSLARAAGDTQDARQLWTRLLAMLTKGSPAYNSVEKNLNDLD
jgi:cytochrome c-type biogenesis protein CcmH